MPKAKPQPELTLTDPSPLTNPALDDALTRLRAAGCDVRRQGMHWLVRRPGQDAGVLTGAEVLEIATDYPAPAASQPGGSGGGDGLQPGSSPDNALPLVDLITALEDHAAGLPRPLPRDHRIPLPAGLPERLPIPHQLVVPGRYQPRTRFDQDKLDELAASIQEHGILTALKAFANERGQLELIAGERRLRAARVAGLSFVPIELCSYSLRQIDEISTIDNLQRDDLTPIEEGTAYERMIREWQISEAELARRLGKNRAYIQQRRAIAGAAPEVIQALDNAQITFSQARAVAQAAPEEPKIQKQALTLIISRLAQGRQVTEKEAKDETEKIARKRAQQVLEALGWLFTADGHAWSSGDRPTLWTGAETFLAVKEQRRPSTTPIEGTPDAAVLATLQQRYSRVKTEQAPWIGLSSDWNIPLTYYAPAELPALAQQVADELAALQIRAAAHGWAIEAKTTSYGSGDFTLTGAKGGRDRCYYWSSLVEKVRAIEEGKLVDRAPETGRGQPSYTPKCSSCKNESGALRHIGGQTLCPECAAPLIAAQQAEHAAMVARIDPALGAWLRSAPAGAIPLLAAVLGGDAIEEEMDAAAVVDQVAMYIQSYIEDGDDLQEDAPTVAALLGLTRQAALPGGSPAIAADSPLFELSGQLTKIEAWIAQLGDTSPSLDVIQLQRANLEQLGDDLDQFADDETIEDKPFEDLMHRIGQATLALITLTETGVAPELAEVAA